MLAVANFYPEKISERFHAPGNAGELKSAHSVGTGASFLCGSFVRFFLNIDPQTKRIRKAKFKSNGCGFAVAAADVLAEIINGKLLTELRGLDKSELETQLEKRLEGFPENRRHCPDICFEALQSALADFRASQIEEFTGEKALVCTCFGVSEEKVEKIIAENQVETIEEVAAFCNAGKGCGSCQFLIQEMIDIYQRENL